MLLGAEGLGQLANLLLVVILARHYGATVLGEYSLGMSVGAIASLGISLGIDSLLIRELSRYPERMRAALGVLLPVQLVLVPLAWLLSIAISLALLRSRAALPMVAAVTAYQLLGTVGTLLLSPLQAGERMLRVAACEFAYRLVALLLGVALMGAGAGVALLALVFPLSGMVLVALAVWQLSRTCGLPALRWAPAEARGYYRQAMPFFGSTALSILYSRTSTLLLGLQVARRELGLYSAADRLMVPLLLGPQIFNTAVFPALSRLAHESPQAAHELCGRCIRLLLCLALPLTLLVMLWAPQAVTLCFGADYDGAASALRWLVWSLPVRGVQYLLGSLLAASGRQSSVAGARAVGLVSFAVLAPVLIHFLGYIGAAMAVPLCDAMQLGLYVRAVRRVRGTTSVPA
jgi:O-antigen/teichoic acid export membrane protein